MHNVSQYVQGENGACFINKMMIKKVIQKRLCKFTAKYRNDTERRGIDEIKRNTKK